MPQGLVRGYLFLRYPMPSIVEPTVKRAVVYFDGQNLFYAAKEAFGYNYPNYDPHALAEWVCGQQGLALEQVRFYTGVPNIQDHPRWNQFWSRKLSAIGKAGAHIYSRPLRYRNQSITLSDGTQRTVLVGQEKGVDVRIALDIIRMAHHGEFDVAVVFSQDQDLSEVAAEIRVIAREQQRWIRIVSAFPASPTYTNTRGIDKTDWVRISRQVYDACIDRRDYRTNV
jgi:uncharacterized LabA/DUF88 family protein